MAESILEPAICVEASGTAETVIRVVRNTADIEEIRPIWEAWQHHPNADIDFYLMILGQRPEIIRPHIIVVSRGGSPATLLVGRIEDRRLAFKVGYFTLMRPKVRLLTLPFGGLLGNGSSEHCDALVSEVMKSLRRGEADLALFEPMDTKSALYHQVRTSPSWFSKDYLRKTQVHRSMDLYSDIEAFYQSLSPKARKNLKWQAKKLLAEFPGMVNVAVYQTPADLDVMTRDVEAIAERTYQRGLGVGFSDSPETRTRLRLEAEKGWFRGYVLYLGGKPCAFWLGTVYQDTFHSNFMGYDPAYAKHSPGMFLVTKVLTDLCTTSKTHNLAKLDFGLGDAQYKQVLGTECWDESGPCIFAPSAKGLLVNAVRTCLGQMDGAMRKVLERTSFLARLKAVWRKSVRRQSTPEPEVGTR